jgi:hypothetical protein
MADGREFTVYASSNQIMNLASARIGQYQGSSEFRKELRTEPKFIESVINEKLQKTRGV